MYTQQFKRLRRFLDSEGAATTVEYAVMLAVIIIFSIGAVLNTGQVQQSLWTTTGDALKQTWDDSTSKSN